MAEGTELSPSTSLRVTLSISIGEGIIEEMIGQLAQRLLEKDDRHTWRRHLVMIYALRQWQSKVDSYPVLDTTNGDVTAYVANFKRPQNIPLIVRALLACPSINRIIVSNNNPECRLEEWFQPTSDRVSVLRHAEPQSCSMRYIHLCAFSSPSYLIIDDDLFLLPPQIEQLLGHLKSDPSVPHGLYGQRWENGFFRGGFMQAEEELDVISRVYAFSAEHLVRLFLVAEVVGHRPDADVWKLSRFDDMFLSFSGKGKPRIHDVGPLVDCPTQGKKGTATWREEGFHTEREQMYVRLCDAQTPAI